MMKIIVKSWVFRPYKNHVLLPSNTQSESSNTQHHNKFRLLSKYTYIFSCEPEKNSYSLALYACSVQQSSWSNHLWRVMVLIRKIDHFPNTWTESGERYWSDTESRSAKYILARRSVHPTATRPAQVNLGQISYKYHNSPHRCHRWFDLEVVHGINPSTEAGKNKRIRRQQR